MKLLSFFLVSILTASQLTDAVPLFPPPLSDHIFIDQYKTHVGGELTDVMLTQYNTTIFNLRTLSDEFSYNCLTKKFELALKLGNLIGQTNFHLEGIFKFFFGSAHINVTGKLDLNCHAKPSDDSDSCLVVGAGQIIGSDQVQMDSLVIINPVDAFKLTNVMVEAGTIENAPIEDIGVVIVHDIAKALTDTGVSEFVASKIHLFINDVIFKTKTLQNLHTMTGGGESCNAQPIDGDGHKSKLKRAIIPTLPDKIKFEPSRHDHLALPYSTWFEYTRIATGLENLLSELSFNCFTGRWELGLILPNMEFESPFLMEGSYMTLEPTGVNLTFSNVMGVMKENCGHEKDCLLSAHGQIKGQEDGHVIVDDWMALEFEIKMNFQVTNGTVNGRLWDENPIYVSHIQEALAIHRNAISMDVRRMLENYFKQILATKTMTEMIAMSNGSCQIES